MDKINIIIADDHKLFRDGIKALIDHYDHLNVYAEANDGEELLTKLDDKTSIVLLDINMPVKSGIEAMIEAREKHPNVKFIILTMHKDGKYVMESVRHGASGFLLKNADEEEMINAIETVARGNKYYNDYVTELMFNRIEEEQVTEGKLSDRETEVLKLVADGSTTKQIADILFISTRTVETHRVNMMKKLNVSNTAELIKKAAELNLL